MTRRIALLLFLALALPPAAPLFSEPLLWYSRPADQWEKALPVGNGRLGAMIFGRIENERIQFNEDTVWAGSPVERDIVGAYVHLPEIRQLLFDGRYVEAQRMTQARIMGERIAPRAYQTLGDLLINSDPPQSPHAYRRELDLDTGIARTQWTERGTTFSSEVFSSEPHQVIVVHIASDQPRMISRRVGLQRGVDANTTVEDGDLVLRGRASHGGKHPGVRFEARLSARVSGGSVHADGTSLVIEEADSVTLILSAATDYYGSQPTVAATQQLAATAGVDYSELRRSHVEDHRALFRRVSLDLGGEQERLNPTDVRLQAMRAGEPDPDLEATYFQYGRYLLMASSRPGTMPANMQGIWNYQIAPSWNADYHLNINVQMNYWPADVTNLSELQEPLWDLLDNLRVRGRMTAKNVYNARGFVAHHTTDAWWWTSPAGSAKYGMWTTGAAWTARHLWESYLFNGDTGFLRSRAYPILKEASEFFLDWLVENPDTGKLVSGPATSPENDFITEDGKTARLTMGPAMDQ